ncbi:unnamed protein product [Mytilus coruscus]|uniref:Endonuclease/exonuclease/phosphatase domain-containing protein n=1 Tax=Mytilus coruscus TaxID=42192 RepID=A0A6J8AZV2_MYTCO|nr:unnamed protein product [Mytilus coruscus]
MDTFNVPVYDSPMIQQNRSQFQQYALSQQPIPNPNFTQLSPTIPAARFYTSNPHNLQPMMNPAIDAYNKLDIRTQKVIEICDKMSVIDELSKKLNSFDKTVQTLVKTVENVSKRVDEEHELYVRSAFNEIRSEKDATNNTIFRLQQDLDDLYDRHIDLQTRSMRENLIFTGIPLHDKDEQTEQTERIIENFMVNQLKLNRPAEYERAHRFGFRNYKEREFVRKAARELRDTGFGISEQFPKKLMTDEKRYGHSSKKHEDRRKPISKILECQDNNRDETTMMKGLAQNQLKEITTGDVSKNNIRTNLEAKIQYEVTINTNYTSEEAFNDIELELQRFPEKSDYIILVGDFNSRTANLSDFYDEDDIDDFVIDNLTDQSDYTDLYMLDDLNISRTRNNPDKVVNCYGRKFLEFCKNNEVFILNGRVGQDVIGRDLPVEIIVL